MAPWCHLHLRILLSTSFTIFSVWLLSSCLSPSSHRRLITSTIYFKEEEKEESKDFPKNLQTTSLYISLTKTVSRELLTDDVRFSLSASSIFAYFYESYSHYHNKVCRNGERGVWQGQRKVQQDLMIQRKENIFFAVSSHETLPLCAHIWTNNWVRRTGYND